MPSSVQSPVYPKHCASVYFSRFSAVFQQLRSQRCLTSKKRLFVSDSHEHASSSNSCTLKRAAKSYLTIPELPLPEEQYTITWMMRSRLRARYRQTNHFIRYLPLSNL